MVFQLSVESLIVFRIKVTFFEKHAELILLSPRKALGPLARKALGPLAGTFGRDREEDGGRETEDRKREAGPLAGDRTLASPPSEFACFFLNS